MEKITTILIALLMATNLSAQKFSFFTDQPTGNQFTTMHKSNGKAVTVQEGENLFLDIDFEEMKITRMFTSHLSIEHKIDWTEDQQVGGNTHIWRIKTNDGWRFYITWVKGLPRFCRVVDRHNKATLYKAKI